MLEAEVKTAAPLRLKLGIADIRFRQGVEGGQLESVSPAGFQAGPLSQGNHRACSGGEHGIEAFGAVHPAAEAQGEPAGSIEDFSGAGQGLALQVEDTGENAGNQSVVGPIFVSDLGPPG